LKKRFVPIYSILAIAIILLSVLVPSCNGGGRTFGLTMAVSPLGSGTAVDLTAGSPYTSGTAVSIQATPLGSYQFVKWTAPAGTFANATAAATTFTIPAQNVTVTAHFVGPLDHFKSYNVADASPVGKDVTLHDQFITINATVRQAMLFANPASKVHMPPAMNISNPDHHLTFYWLNHTEYGRQWNVEVKNQFGTQLLTVGGPVALAVPTQKLVPGNHTQPVGLDHFLVYAVVNQVTVGVPVGLKDEFGDDPEVGVGEAIFFANPVEKTVPGAAATPIMHPDEHLVFYKVTGSTAQPPTTVQAVNQFNTQTQNLYLSSPASLLGVPSEKLEWGEQLDHFTVYRVFGETEPVGKTVSLKDQFVDITTNVTDAYYFCNPAAKTLTESWPPIVHPDYHLTVYPIDYQSTQAWSVLVENQFGKQTLTVSGPIALGVPTQKLVPGDHGFPDGLDHFLLYAVGAPYEPTGVAVKDQFCPGGETVSVGMPMMFGVPVQKTVGSEVTDIKNPLTHLVFYGITGAQCTWPWVLTNDQFLLGQNLTLGDPAGMLGVPSLKLEFHLLPP
jgi:Divergent InlB B-repeat domain